MCLYGVLNLLHAPSALIELWVVLQIYDLDFKTLAIPGCFIWSRLTGGIHLTRLAALGYDYISCASLGRDLLASCRSLTIKDWRSGAPGL